MIMDLRNYNNSPLRKVMRTIQLVALVLAPAFGATAFAQYESTTSESKSSYRLRATDLIKISVYGEPDLETKQRITGNGYVAVPLLGKIRLAGSTVDEAQHILEMKFVTSELLRSPTVTISVEDYSRRTITVLGRVHSPGEIEMGVESEAVSIQQAIAAAGGFTRLAATSSVKLIRHDPQKGKTTWTIDVDDQLTDGNQNARIMVYPGDTIFVPERII